jgi:hypothetical protein
MSRFLKLALPVILLVASSYDAKAISKRKIRRILPILQQDKLAPIESYPAGSDFFKAFSDRISSPEGQRLVELGQELLSTYEDGLETKQSILLARFNLIYKEYLNSSNIMFESIISDLGRNMVFTRFVPDEASELAQYGLCATDSADPSKASYEISVEVDRILIGLCTQDENFGNGYFEESLFQSLNHSFRESDGACDDFLFSWSPRQPDILTPTQDYIRQLSRHISTKRGKKRRWYRPTIHHLFFDSKDIEINLKDF